MSTFRRILQYGKPYGRYWPPYLLLSILSVVFGIANYALLGPFLTVLFENETITVTARPEFAFSLDYVKAFFSWLLADTIQSGGVLRGLLLVSGSLVAACFLADLCRYLSQRILVRLKTRMMGNLRDDLFRKVAEMPVGGYGETRKGDILSSVSNDVNEVQNSIAGSFHVLFREPLLIVGFLAMLFYMSPRLTLVSLIALPVSALVITRITRRLRAESVETQSLMGRILSHFDEALSGARIIKAFRAEGYVGKRFSQTNDVHRRSLRRVWNRQELASPVSEFLGITIGAVVLFYGGWLNLHGQLGMSWESFIVYIMFYWKVLEPAKALSNSYAQIRKGLVSGERIFALIDTPVRIQEIPDAKPVTGFERGVEFRGVTFSYGGEPVLRDVSFTLPKGRMVAIVGPSGAGKSTLADLLPRFRDVAQGSILLDGTDIRALRLSDLRSLMGIVPQEAVLFNDTVFGNIAFGQENVTMEQVVAAARIANADEFISKMEKGYLTNIGEGGGKLSGGQRQRIAIARAVLKNPPILILDEATSSLDTESERLVQEALASLMQNRTSLVIAHRLSTIRHADEIIVLQEGAIIERGTHDELVAKDGLYSHLCRLQDFS